MDSYDDGHRPAAVREDEPMISAHEWPTHKVAITEPYPGCPEITVDGQPLRSVTRALLSLDTNGPPVLSITLLALTGIGVGVQSRVVLDEPTAKTLTAMGWTPPGETEHR